MDNSKAEVMPQQAIELNGIVYLPHYQEQGKFVSPGYGVNHWESYYSMELVALGAKVITEALWPRARGTK